MTLTCFSCLYILYDCGFSRLFVELLVRRLSRILIALARRLIDFNVIVDVRPTLRKVWIETPAINCTFLLPCHPSCVLSQFARGTASLFLGRGGTYIGRGEDSRVSEEALLSGDLDSLWTAFQSRLVHVCVTRIVGCDLRVSPVRRFGRSQCKTAGRKGKNVYLRF